jgi:diacylglycerol kinase (ATP)
MSGSCAVIVNPASGRGLGRRRLGAVKKAFARHDILDVACTRHAGDERALVHAALQRGATTLVAVGGDGTWSNVADGILSSGADCRLALVASGTGNDFVKTLGVPAHDLERTARLCAGNGEMRVDVGRVEGRYFLNIVGFGFDTAVLEDMVTSSLLRGRALYIRSALRQLLRFQGLHVDARTATMEWGGHHLLLIVANARHFGGSFRIAPNASPQDGLLDAISILDAPVLRRVALFHAVMQGRHMALPEVRSHQAERVHLRFKTPPAFEADGEYRLASSNEVEVVCVPRALRIVTAGQTDGT